MEIRPRIKVLHIIPSVAQGGAERILADLITNSRMDIEHHVVSLIREEPFYTFEAESRQDLGLRRGRFSLAAASRLRRIARTLRPDIVHAWLYHGNFASVSLVGMKLPIVWSIHNTDLSPRHSRWLTRAVNLICAALSRYVPSVVAYVSAEARAIHERKGYASCRGVLVPNGIDLARFRLDPAARTRIRADLGIGPSQPLIGCVGRFDPQKGHETVLAAFAALERADARLVLVGRDITDDNATLMHCLEAAGVAHRTLLLGPRADMPAVMSALDVLVSGSSYGEALPMVAMEAAAIGLPVVATRVGEVTPFVIRPRHVVAPQAPQALAEALADALGLLGTQELACAQERRRATLVAEFSLARMIRRYEALYGEVLGRQLAGGASGSSD